MTEQPILSAIRHTIQDKFSGEGTGHDYFHIERVVKTALYIAQQENADLFMVELSAWVHDVGDHKLNNGIDKSEEQISALLNQLNIPQDIIDQVIEIVSQVSFSKGKIAESLEATVVQDADRLDALGAIGIARTFAYGGSKHRQIWHPDQPGQTSVQHFYDKLLHLKDRMHTNTARRMAAERHRYLQEFLERFYEEWDGKDFSAKMQ